MKKYNIQNFYPARGVSFTDENLSAAVRAVGEEVKTRGDAALKAFAKKFDNVELENLIISTDAADCCAELKDALATARENIEKFHKAELPSLKEKMETSRGVFCWREFKAIEKVGLYVPGGSAPLFSTVLMLAVPAVIAGCKEIVVCTPPQKDGSVAAEILYACKMLGIKNVFAVGGAQAIFAMAYGTDSVPKVDKIFGPGNQYVTEAKMQISNFCAIDMPAGPSEVLVIADDGTNAAYAAADILSQAEHGVTSQSVLVCSDEKKLEEILAEVDRQLAVLPRQKEAAGSLENSYALFAPDLGAAMDFVNAYAPEHLIIATKNYEELAEKVINAGSVFLGPYSSESFGDYASGTNHTLPTSGFARSYGGLGVESFGKWVTYQEIKKDGLFSLGEKVALMAEKEGLGAHANAVKIRLDGEKK